MRYLNHSTSKILYTCQSKTSSVPVLVNKIDYHSRMSNIFEVAAFSEETKQRSRIILMHTQSPFETSSRWPFIKANCWKSLVTSQTRAVVSLLADANFFPLLSKVRSRTSSSCPRRVARQEFILVSQTLAVLSMDDEAINEQSKL